MPKQKHGGAHKEFIVQLLLIYGLYAAGDAIWTGINNVAMAGSNQVKMLPMKVGVLFLDGDDHPICPPTGVHLVLNELGEPWPPGVSASISGHPDPITGLLVVKTTFPVHPTFIRHLSQAYKQAPDAKR